MSACHAVMLMANYLMSCNCLQDMERRCKDADKNKNQLRKLEGTSRRASNSGAATTIAVARASGMTEDIVAEAAELAMPRPSMLAAVMSPAHAISMLFNRGRSSGTAETAQETATQTAGDADVHQLSTRKRTSGNHASGQSEVQGTLTGRKRARISGSQADADVEPSQPQNTQQEESEMVTEQETDMEVTTNEDDTQELAAPSTAGRPSRR